RQDTSSRSTGTKYRSVHLENVPRSTNYHPATTSTERCFYAGQKPPCKAECTKMHTIDKTLLAKRASRPMAALPRAFLRWVGSKRKRLPELLAVLPSSYNIYYEPFLGSGSLFFLLEPQRAVLGDTCRELIATFLALRDNAEAVVRYLRQLTPDRHRYYSIRAKRSRGRFKRAAEFIFLNRTCWNGLYRVNLQGQFNVPYGRPKSDFICDSENLQACRVALLQK